MSFKRDMINIVEEIYYRSGTSSLQFLDANYVTQLYGIAFKEYSPFFETYNEIKGWLESNGIMEKLRQGAKIMKGEPEELGPQVLTMDHLRLGFLACLIPAAVSFAVFVGELVWFRLAIAFREKMQKVFKEKREIGARIVSICEEICDDVDRDSLLQDDLIEVCSMVEENSTAAEDEESGTIDEVVVELEMRESKPASNHPEPSQESRGNVDDIALMQDNLIEVHCLSDLNSTAESEPLQEVMVESEMCKHKPASNHPEASQKSHDDNDSINELIEILNMKAQTK